MQKPISTRRYEVSYRVGRTPYSCLVDAVSEREASQLVSATVAFGWHVEILSVKAVG